MENGCGKRVCVTGAGGFVASSLVKLLLSLGYSVHGTVRNPSDPKNEPLMKVVNAKDKLQLFKADLLDYKSISEAMEGCQGVFHVASPVPSSSVSNPEIQLMEPAVKGTLTVLQASLHHKLNRVVFVSSMVAVAMNPDWPHSQPKDESCWSDTNYCKTTQNWYCASKTEAEKEAYRFAKENGVDLVSLCPTLVLGPVMQSASLNSSSLVLLKLLKEGYESVENKLRLIVDVRDVVEALRLIYEKPEAQGRYICTAHSIRTTELVDKLRNIYPHYNYPKSFTEAASGEALSVEKLKRLGWSCRPLDETLIDSVESYKTLGLLN